MIPPFFDDITKYGSLSVVGMAKNAGKTVCLRALLDYYASPEKASKMAVTSIGTDGESVDAVTQTAKPELTFYPGMLVQTAEQYYLRRRLTADIIDVSRETTACGRVVSARVLNPGKMIISGYAHTQGLRRYIGQAHEWGAQTAIIDGALSRMSLASPFVSEAMILCTGAAVSKSLNELVQKTKFQYTLMNLPVYNPYGAQASRPASFEPLCGSPLKNADREVRTPYGGIYGIDPEGQAQDLSIPSLLQINNHIEKIEPYCASGCHLYISGMLSDPFLKFLTARRHRPDLIVTDFSKLFITAPVYNAFLRAGSRILVLQQPKILGVCVNPYSPEGYVLDSAMLRERMSEALGREIYDIMQE